MVTTPSHCDEGNYFILLLSFPEDIKLPFKFLGDMNNKTTLHENPRTKHFDIANAHHDGPILSWFIILLNPMKKVRISNEKKKKI